jgi:hypothetical protein
VDRIASRMISRLLRLDLTEPGHQLIIVSLPREILQTHQAY